MLERRSTQCPKRLFGPHARPLIQCHARGRVLPPGRRPRPPGGASHAGHRYLPKVSRTLMSRIRGSVGGSPRGRSSGPTLARSPRGGNRYSASTPRLPERDGASVRVADGGNSAVTPRWLPSRRGPRAHTVRRMGIGRLSLELPMGVTAAEAEREAARVLAASGLTGWTDLTLQTTLTTGVVGRSNIPSRLDGRPRKRPGARKHVAVCAAPGRIERRGGLLVGPE